MNPSPSTYRPQPGTIAACALNVGPKLRQGTAGREKLCARCECWLPATSEFFYRAAAEPSGCFYCCKVCYRAWRSNKLAGLPTRLDAEDDADLPVVRRIVPAAEAEPLNCAPLAHGWIPSLEGVHVEVEPRALPPRAPGRQVEVDQPSIFAVTGLGWRAPSSAPSVPPAPVETAMREPEMASAEQRPERAAGASGDRDLDGYSPTGRRLIAFFERVLRGEGAEC